MTNTTKTLAKMLITLGLLVGSANALQLIEKGYVEGKHMVEISYDDLNPRRDGSVKWNRENVENICSGFLDFYMYELGQQQRLGDFLSLTEKQMNFAGACALRLEEISRLQPNEAPININVRMRYIEVSGVEFDLYGSVIYYYLVNKYNKGKVYSSDEYERLLKNILHNIEKSNGNTAELKKMPKPSWDKDLTVEQITDIKEMIKRL